VHTAHGSGEGGSLRPSDGRALRVANIRGLTRAVLTECDGDVDAAWALLQQRNQAVMEERVFQEHAAVSVLQEQYHQAREYVHQWGCQESFLQFADQCPVEFGKYVVSMKEALRGLCADCLWRGDCACICCLPPPVQCLGTAPAR
jgi:hypothetical protein